MRPDIFPGFFTGKLKGIARAFIRPDHFKLPYKLCFYLGMQASNPRPHRKFPRFFRLPDQVRIP
jgi:hypothetical protein